MAREVLAGECGAKGRNSRSTDQTSWPSMASVHDGSDPDSDIGENGKISDEGKNCAVQKPTSHRALAILVILILLALALQVTIWVLAALHRGSARVSHSFLGRTKCSFPHPKALRSRIFVCDSFSSSPSACTFSSQTPHPYPYGSPPATDGSMLLAANHPWHDTRQPHLHDV